MVAIGTHNCFVTCNREHMVLRPLATIVCVACINEPLFDSTIPKYLRTLQLLLFDRYMSTGNQIGNDHLCEKTTDLVFNMLIVDFYISQYECKLSNDECKHSAVSERMTASSANSNM